MQNSQKHVFGKVDYLAENFALNYLRTKEKYEVDFALVRDKQIEKIIEVKHSDSSPNGALRYFHEKYQFPAFQIVKVLKREKIENGIEIIDGLGFLQSLYI